MGYHTVPNCSIQYGLIAYDANGKERSEGDSFFSRELLHHVSRGDVTDIFFFSHGWKGDVPAAIEQYDSWIGALLGLPDLKKAENIFPDFRPLCIGLHWPSLPWGDEEARAGGTFSTPGTTNPESLQAAYLNRLGDWQELSPPLQTIFAEARCNSMPDMLPAQVRQAYLDLTKLLELESLGSSAPPGSDREAFDPEESYQAGNEEAVNFGQLNLGGILGPLRQLSYWSMKKRARTIGEGGIHDFLKDLQVATANKTRIHLMGHSFGTIVISGMLGGKNCCDPLPRAVDSVALVQGAVSLWSYAAKLPFKNTESGYFSRILSDRKISGPLISTRSRFDKAVGRFYPLASRLHGSIDFAADVFPEFGAIGAYGLQGIGEPIQNDIQMLPATAGYNFERGKVYNLEASSYIRRGDGASGAHSDIAGPEVAHAIWEAAFTSAK